MPSLTDQIRALCDQIDTANSYSDWVPPVVILPEVVSPVVPVVSDWQITARQAALEAGFSHALCYEWDWAVPINALDTANIGRLGVNGILVVRFVPTGPVDKDNLASLSAVGHPAPNMMNELTMALSSQPCVLNAPFPGTSVGNSPSLTFGVGTVPISGFTGRPSAVALLPGTPYYINVAGRNNVSVSNPFGTPTAIPSGLNYPHAEVRVTLHKPSGH